MKKIFNYIVSAWITFINLFKKKKMNNIQKQLEAIEGKINGFVLRASRIEKEYHANSPKSLSTGDSQAKEILEDDILDVITDINNALKSLKKLK
jgi:hypothetical protein